jgi:hypothetical protein
MIAYVIWDSYRMDETANKSLLVPRQARDDGIGVTPLETRHCYSEARRSLPSSEVGASPGLVWRRAPQSHRPIRARAGQCVSVG